MADLSTHSSTLPTLAIAARRSDEIRVWLQEAQNGNAQAIDDICLAMRPILVRAAFSIVKDMPLANDLAQDALLKALEHRFWWLPLRRPDAWMLRIVVNLAKNTLRNQKNQQRVVTYTSDISTEQQLAFTKIASSTLTPEEQILLHEQQNQQNSVVVHVWQQLSPQQQDVLQLRLLGELSFAAIADALSIKETHARVVASQGIRKMQQILQKQQDATLQNMTFSLQKSTIVSTLNDG